MKLDDITLPVSYGWGCAHALVFGEAMAAKLAAVQASYGNPMHVPAPVALVDGRFMLTADILTECIGGFLAEPFARLDRSQFAEVDVLPIEEAAALIPPPEMPEPL